MSALVQISDLKNLRNRTLNAEMVRLANAPRPKLLLELVDELSRMFERIGMSAICRGCFADTNPKPLPNGGCCHKCPMLGHNKCLAKPLLCATWMCGVMHQTFESTSRFLFDLKQSLYEANVPIEAWETGVRNEAHFRPNLKQREALQKAITDVRAWGVV